MMAGASDWEAPTTWRIRAGRNDEARAQFLDPLQPVVALGWCEQENLSRLPPDFSAFKNSVTAYYPDSSPASISSAAGQLFRFVHEMRAGDYVVYPEMFGGPVHCGLVQGKYVYREGDYPRHNSSISPHVRAVVWLRSLPRGTFTREELHDLSTPPTLLRLTLASLIRRCFPGEHPDDSPTADPTELDQRVGRLLARGGIPRPEGNRAPRRIVGSQATYERDPRVKAWVLQEANGVCELCGRPAPFMLSASVPYLEVHHMRPLSEGGPDTLDNAVALCPNCHRRVHLADDAEAQQSVLYAQVLRLIRT